METVKSVDFSSDFIKIAKVIEQNSDGIIRIAHNEKSFSNEKDSSTGTFLKLNEKRIGKDLEVYGQMSRTDKLGHGLPEFLLILFNIRIDCPKSYREATPMLKKIVDELFEDKILENWNRLFA